MPLCRAPGGTGHGLCPAVLEVPLCRCEEALAPLGVCSGRSRPGPLIGSDKGDAVDCQPSRRCSRGSPHVLDVVVLLCCAPSVSTSTKPAKLQQPTGDLTDDDCAFSKDHPRPGEKRRKKPRRGPSQRLCRALSVPVCARPVVGSAKRLTRSTFAALGSESEHLTPSTGC